jgi:hypothetical protein
VKVKALRNVFEVAARHCRQDGKMEEAEALSIFATNLLRADDGGTVAALVREILGARKPKRAARTAGQKSRRSLEKVRHASRAR